jgi:hypothetical protein
LDFFFQNVIGQRLELIAQRFFGFSQQGQFLCRLLPLHLQHGLQLLLAVAQPDQLLRLLLKLLALPLPVIAGLLQLTGLLLLAGPMRGCLLLCFSQAVSVVRSGIGHLIAGVTVAGFLQASSLACMPASCCSHC